MMLDFPVLHYVVSYNTSDNSTVIQTQLSSSISSYTVSSEPGVTYYITVRAVNAVGTGTISQPSTVNGEMDNHCNQSMSSLLIVQQLPTIISSTNTATQVSSITHVTLTSLVTSTTG